LEGIQLFKGRELAAVSQRRGHVALLRNTKGVRLLGFVNRRKVFVNTAFNRVLLEVAAEAVVARLLSSQLQFLVALCGVCHA